MPHQRSAPDDHAVAALRQVIDLVMIRWILTPPVIVLATAMWIPMLERTKSASFKVVTLPAFIADPELLGSQGPVLLAGWSYLLLTLACVVCAAVVMIGSGSPADAVANRLLLVCAALAVVAALALWMLVRNLDPDQIDVQGAFVLAVLVPTWFLGAALAARRHVADPPTAGA